MESGLIRRGEDAAARGDFGNAERWIALAATVRPGSSTIADARARIAGMRRARIARLRDQGMMALLQRDGDKEIALARGKKAYDKRATIAKRDEARSAERETRVR